MSILKSKIKGKKYAVKVKKLKSTYEISLSFLSEELKDNPEQIAMTQSLTLDKSRPYMGLKVTNDLFGSKEWWDSIKQEKCLYCMCRE